MEVKNSSSSNGVKSSNDSANNKEVSLGFYQGNVNPDSNLMTDPEKKIMLQARAFTPSAHQTSEKVNPEFKM